MINFLLYIFQVFPTKCIIDIIFLLKLGFAGGSTMAASGIPPDLCKCASNIVIVAFPIVTATK